MADAQNIPEIAVEDAQQAGVGSNLENSYSVALWDVFEEVIKRLVEGRRTLKDMTIFLKSLAEVQDVYGKGLLKVYAAHKETVEQGSTGNAWSQVKSRLETIGHQHKQFSDELIRLSVDIEEFRTKNLSDRNELIQREKTAKTNLENETIAHNKSKQRYIKGSKELQVAEIQNTAVQGDSFTDKQKQQAKKVLVAAEKEKTDSDTAYKAAVEKLHKMQISFDDEMAQILKKAEEMEFTRMTFIKDQTKLFVLHQESTSSNVQQAVLMMQAVVDTIEPSTDNETFVQKMRTGKEHPDKVVYVEYTEAPPNDVSTPKPKLKPGETDSARKRRSFFGGSKSPKAETKKPAVKEEKVKAEAPAAPPVAAQEATNTTALFDFTGELEGELSFAAGDAVIITSRDESGWWRGIAHKKEGIFPSNYVPEGAGAADTGESTVVGKKCTVLYDYGDAGSPDELVIKTGDIVTILSEAEGWYSGQNEAGGKGMFPANYVELLP